MKGLQPFFKKKNSGFKIRDNQDFCFRKDDCESWLYMQIELTGGRLPWHDIADMKQVGTTKWQPRKSIPIIE